MPSLAEYQQELQIREGKKQRLLVEIAELIGRDQEKKANRRRRSLAKLEEEIGWLKKRISRKTGPGYKETLKGVLKNLSERSLGRSRDSGSEKWNASEIRIELARLKADVTKATEIAEELQPLCSGREGSSLIPSTVGKALSLALRAGVAKCERSMAVLQERLKDAAEREELSQLPMAELQALKEKEELISKILSERTARKPKAPGASPAERMVAERRRLIEERDTVIDGITGGRPREEWDEETEAHVMKVRNYYDDLIDEALSK